jgi:hypothetical protein
MTAGPDSAPSTRSAQPETSFREGRRQCSINRPSERSGDLLAGLLRQETLLPSMEAGRSARSGTSCNGRVSLPAAMERGTGPHGLPKEPSCRNSRWGSSRHICRWKRNGSLPQRKRNLLFRVPLSAHRKPTLSSDVKGRNPNIPDGSGNGEDVSWDSSVQCSADDTRALPWSIWTHRNNQRETPRPTFARSPRRVQRSWR